MVNRILKWWKEVMDWKERFEKLLPANYTNGRTFKKAELRKLEKLVSYPKAKLNEEERLSQKMLYEQQYKELERSLYPNPLIRLFRNAGKLAISTLKWSAGKIISKIPSNNKTQEINKNSRQATTDSEIRTFLNKSIAEAGNTQNKKVSKKNEAPEMKNKVSVSKGQRKGVIVPFKPAKTVRKGI